MTGTTEEDHLVHQLDSAKNSITNTLLSHMAQCSDHDRATQVCYAMAFTAVSTLAGMVAEKGNMKDDLLFAIELLKTTVDSLPDTLLSPTNEVKL